MDPVSEPDVADALVRHGPLTGSQLLDVTRSDVMTLWRVCRRASRLEMRSVATRFLRLDRGVEGYARLTPSIRREFLTYTLVSLRNQSSAAAERTERLRQDIVRISREKRALARETVDAVLAGLPEGGRVAEQVCFILAGDVVYDMAHAVPRPEQSTGEMVRGSDLDVVAICDDRLGPESTRLLDAAIYVRKGFLLGNPAYREEIDYLVKDMARVREQLRFDTFESMVACKILWEGQFLAGSQAVYDALHGLLRQHGIDARLRAQLVRAEAHRIHAEQALEDPDVPPCEDFRNLFFTHVEGDEIY
jgi:hypothetical protein